MSVVLTKYTNHNSKGKGKRQGNVLERLIKTEETGDIETEKHSKYATTKSK